jgi:excinuclease UvrABC nuclease subunit
MADLYRMYDTDGQLLYIGQSISLAERLGQHRAGSAFWSAVRTITVEPHPNVSAARLAEAKAIQAERPVHNRTHSARPGGQWGRSTEAERQADRVAYLADRRIR